MSTGMDRHTWDRRYAEAQYIWTATPNRFLVEETAELGPGRALDLACGEGRNAVWLAERGWQVTGVDFSEVALDKARRLAEDRGVSGEWIASDLLGYTPASQAFDLVLVFYLQIPEQERRVVLRRAADAVAPGGTLLIVAHDSANLTDGYGGPQDPRVLHSAPDIVADLSGSALDVERAEQVHRPVAVGGEERIALDALVRASRPAS
jgi:SAM-dependent methyltransferase